MILIVNILDGSGFMLKLFLIIWFDFVIRVKVDFQMKFFDYRWKFFTLIHGCHWSIGQS